jgi:hypothetical protein
MPPGRLPDLSVSRHFTYEPPKPPAICQTAVCKLCGEHRQAKSVDRERKHLLNKCPRYKEWEATNSQKLQMKIEKHLIYPVGPDRKTKLDNMFAFAMYKTGQLFTAFEDDSWTAFFAELGYQPLSATTLATTLLDKAFDKIEIAVDLQLSASQSLNLVTDESINISGNRIINTSAITNNSNCFYILNIEAEPGKLRAEELVDKAVDTAEKITKKDLSKVVL